MKAHPEAESKEKLGVRGLYAGADYLCRLQSRLKNIYHGQPYARVDLKGIVQPFELGGVTSLIRLAVRFCKAGHFPKKILMIQSHERSLKQNSAA